MRYQRVVEQESLSSSKPAHNADIHVTHTLQGTSLVFRISQMGVRPVCACTRLMRECIFGKGTTSGPAIVFLSDKIVRACQYLSVNSSDGGYRQECKGLEELHAKSLGCRNRFFSSVP